MAALELRGVQKRFGALQAVDDVSLLIERGEFLSILGPSGCGKTTLLRLVAGFERPDAGTILLNGRDLTHTPPQERGIGMVFQNYALFPHLDVGENVAFGLKTRHVPSGESAARVERVLDAVGLGAKRKLLVATLSGGEQQRVALARALVIEPALLVFDEPLSNLDVTLRLQMREEIRRLQKASGITAVYVTHDQAEAMSLSHRIAVMRAGAFDQVGTPEEVYQHPSSPSVAQFLGGATLLEGVIAERGTLFKNADLTLPIPGGIAAADGPVTLAIRPEAVRLHPGGQEGFCCGTIEDREYLGFTTTVVVRFGALVIHGATVSSEETRGWIPGTTVGLSLDWSACALFPRGGA